MLQHILNVNDLSTEFKNTIQVIIDVQTKYKKSF